MDFGLSLRETVEAYGLMAQKALGQNFLLDKNITDKIVRLSLDRQGLENFSGINMIEIGPGPGGLTRSVLEQQPQSLTVVEMDKRCVAIMEALQDKTGHKMQIINQDALATDLTELAPLPRQIISNLPYNISVPLLVGWLKQMPQYQAMTLMFQKEVADRITAPIKSKIYGRVSVLAQLVCKIDKLTDINPECFVPAPKVWSTVLLFRPLAQIPDADILEKVEKITALAFGQRRKMLRQSLKSIGNLDKICEGLGIQTTKRAEELLPAEYLSLAEKI